MLQNETMPRNSNLRTNSASQDEEMLRTCSICSVRATRIVTIYRFAAREKLERLQPAAYAAIQKLDTISLRSTRYAAKAAFGDKEQQTSAMEVFATREHAVLTGFAG